MAIYYVATAGSDAANGTSTGTPWQTIAKVNGSTFAAGDSILFNRGDTWRETLTVPSSGSVGNPITLGAYGSGALPILSGANLVTGWVTATGGDSGGLFVGNAEANNTAAFTGVVTAGSATFASGAVKNTGSYGYTSTADGTNSALGYKTLSAQTNIYTRLYFRVKSGYSLSASGDQVLLAFEESGGTNQVFRVGVRFSSGVLTVFMSDRIVFSIYSTVGLVTTDTWHKLLIHTVIGASGGISVTLNDVDTMTSGFSTNLTGHSIDRVRFGINSNTDAKMGSGSIVYLDDIKIDTSTIGSVTVGGPAGTYAATVTTVPRAVWENGVQLTEAATLAALVPSSWFHDGSTLLYAIDSNSSDPDTKTMEAATRLNGVKIADKSYVTVDSLQAEKTNDTNKGAIWAYTTTGTNTTNVSVINSTVVFGMSGIMFQSVDNAVASYNTVSGDLSTDLSGVYTEQLSTAQSMQNPTVTYNILHDLKFATLQPITGVTINTVNGIWGHNTCYNLQNYGMQFNLASAPVIEYNMVHDGGSTIQDTHGIHWADSVGAIVRYNLVYNWHDLNDWSGGGFQADNNSDNSQIYGNIAYNNDGAGFSILNASGVLVYNNTSYHNCTRQHFAEFCVQSPNNVGLNKAAATLKNNIGVASAGAYAVFVDANSEAHTQVIDNNLWFIASGNWWYHGGAASGINLTGGTAGSSLATWNAVSYVGADLNADPLMTNPGANAFMLQSGSPARNAGVNLGATYDDALDPASTWPSGVVTIDQDLYGSGWEIGAYGYPVNPTATHYYSQIGRM